MKLLITFWHLFFFKWTKTIPPERHHFASSATVRNQWLRTCQRCTAYSQGAPIGEQTTSRRPSEEKQHDFKCSQHFATVPSKLRNSPNNQNGIVWNIKTLSSHSVAFNSCEKTTRFHCGKYPKGSFDIFRPLPIRCNSLLQTGSCLWRSLWLRIHS